MVFGRMMPVDGADMFRRQRNAAIGPRLLFVNCFQVCFYDNICVVATGTGLEHLEHLEPIVLVGLYLLEAVDLRSFDFPFSWWLNWRPSGDRSWPDDTAARDELFAGAVSVRRKAPGGRTTGLPNRDCETPPKPGKDFSRINGLALRGGTALEARLRNNLRQKSLRQKAEATNAIQPGVYLIRNIRQIRG